MQFLPSGNSSRDCHRFPAELRHLFIAFIPQRLSRQQSRRKTAGIKSIKLPVHPDLCKSITAEAIGCRLKHDHAGCRGQRRIHRIASGLDNIQSGLSRQRLRCTDHALSPVDYLPPGWVLIIQNIITEIHENPSFRFTVMAPSQSFKAIKNALYSAITCESN